MLLDALQRKFICMNMLKHVKTSVTVFLDDLLFAKRIKNLFVLSI